MTPGWLAQVREQSAERPVGVAEMLWKAVLEVKFLSGKSIAEFKPSLSNKDKVGVWCKDLGKIDLVVLNF